eukprot:gnl/MRDRNA2_/MRDRNA2_115628_c0_seq1.p1 gnl/MRDRNA2_/MRDRNA2_115628_c0~~gnl/MRDRNA2_/MRDRNA2_115628_c0_seq1.p1  ORF type:complete len:123 (+),score=23.32 gnl/MRDRNA2_/MRDRNA2_115628_c0_seq1:59-427(+)
MLPLLVLGALGLNYQAARELDEVSTTLDKNRRPLTDFWGGICIGLVIGLWVGVNQKDRILAGMSMLETMSSWAQWATGIGAKDDKPAEVKHPGQQPTMHAQGQGWQQYQQPPRQQYQQQIPG